MKKIPEQLRKKIAKDSFMEQCIHAHFGQCRGRITWEHAWIYAGKQIQETWAIVPCCEKHNVDVSARDKRYNQYIALKRATKRDLEKYPNKNWNWELKKLNLMFSCNKNG